MLVEQEDGTVIPLAEGSLDQVPSVDEGANRPTVVLPESGAVAVGDNRAVPEQPQGNPEGGT